MASSEAGEGDSVDELQASNAPSRAESINVATATATLSPLQHRPRVSTSTADDEQAEDAMDEDSQESAQHDADELAIEIVVPPPINRDEYTRVSPESEDDAVERVLEEVEGDDVCYKVLYRDGREDIVSAYSALPTTSPGVFLFLARPSIF